MASGRRSRFKIWGNNTEQTITINLPPNDIPAVSDAYRLGLAAAALSHLKSEEAAEHTLRYITRATQEEIWFWASKYLGVVDKAINTRRVVEALCVISGAKKKLELISRGKKHEVINPER